MTRCEPEARRCITDCTGFDREPIVPLMNCILHCAPVGFDARIQMIAPTRSHWCFFDNCEGSAVVNPVPPDAVTKTWDATDRVVGEFEEALERSERPSIRAELDRVGPEARERLFIELARLEIAYSRGNAEAAEPDDDKPVFSESNELDELDDGIERSTDGNTSPAPEADRSLSNRGFLGARRAGRDFSGHTPRFQENGRAQARAQIT